MGAAGEQHKVVAEVAAPRRRRWRWKRLLWLRVLLAAFSCLQVLVLRFIDPPFSAFMAARVLQAWGQGDGGFRIAYDWRDRDQVSSHLPVAVIALIAAMLVLFTLAYVVFQRQEVRA